MEEILRSMIKKYSAEVRRSQRDAEQGIREMRSEVV